MRTLQTLKLKYKHSGTNKDDSSIVVSNMKYSKRKFFVCIVPALLLASSCVDQENAGLGQTTAE